MATLSEVVERARNEGLTDENDVFLPPWIRNESHLPEFSTWQAGLRSTDEYSLSTDRYVPDGPIAEEVHRLGIDALAWYVPFHASPKKCGIYIREAGLGFLSGYFKTLTGCSFAESIESASSLLKLHEESHNHVEILFTFHEFVAKKRLYPRPGSGMLTPVQNRNGSMLTLAQLEEALSNSFAISSVRMRKLKTAAIRFAEEQQPDGYKDWIVVKPRRPFEVGLDALLALTLKNNNIGLIPTYPVFAWAHQRAEEIPTYLVPDEPRTAVKTAVLCEVCKSNPATVTRRSTWGGYLSLCEDCNKHTFT